MSNKDLIEIALIAATAIYILAVIRVRVDIMWRTYKVHPERRQLNLLVAELIKTVREELRREQGENR